MIDFKIILVILAFQSSIPEFGTGACFPQSSNFLLLEELRHHVELSAV
jgi:hypothetical protein